MTRNRDYFRQQVSALFKPSDDAHMRRAVVLGYLRGSAASRTPQEHTEATLGALDALDEANGP